MEINKLLIIPDLGQMEKSLYLAKEYHCGFEYNDFYMPDLLDDEKKCIENVGVYLEQTLPAYCTLHGAFLDVTVASDDSKIVSVSDCRIEQSIQIAGKLRAEAVVFHTNFIPNFHTDFYRKNWVERNEIYWKAKLEKYRDMHLYMENMFDMSYDLLAELAGRLSRYENFGICFDYAHAHVFGDEKKIYEWVKAFAPYVRHIHINDNDFKSDLHQPLGEGRIDWKMFKEFYENYFPEASVLIEVKNLQDIEKSLNFIQSL